MNPEVHSLPLVSVIIPCYNQARYLARSIESVLSQTYFHHEIIVIDDGSADNTKAIAQGFPEVKYVYQQNQGLSAARNTGIDQSRGTFLVFLDSDDWLLPQALEINTKYLLKKPELALVSGGHRFFFEQNNQTREVAREVKDNNYCQLLQSNYIAMIAAVMFRRCVFDKYRYDQSLKVCEDYDLYLKIARIYPIYQHASILAVYRIHNQNMSGNSLLVLKTALSILSRQKRILLNTEEKKWLAEGRNFWKTYYTDIMYRNLLYALNTNNELNKLDIRGLKIYNKLLYIKFMHERNTTSLIKLLKSSIRKIAPSYILKKIGKKGIPAPGKVNFGDLNRTEPLSTQFGYDRGGPVDRYYIENFLQKNQVLTKGRVLEIGDNEYSLRYGGEKLTQSEILHVDASNPKATYIGDLSDAPQLPDNSFDCIILTQTLHLIYNYNGAIATCYRALKPGGTLLLTVPGISHIAQDEWGKYWLWAFTRTSITRIIAAHFAEEKTSIETFGNVLVAAAFLYGMGLPELSKAQMDAHDPHYQVIITVSATK